MLQSTNVINMATIYDVNANELIEKAAEELKKDENIKQPSWAGFVKTGANKERVPSRGDWWYVRAAAVLRTIYRLGPIGVSKLRVRYGSKKRRGYKPPRFCPCSGNIIRKILQQLEKSGFIDKEDKKVHKGRKITSKGKSFLDKIAVQIYKGRIKEVKVETKEAREKQGFSGPHLAEPKQEKVEVKKPVKQENKAIKTETQNQGQNGKI